MTESTDGGAWNTVATDLPTSTTSRSLRPKHSYRFAVRAITTTGATTPWVAGPTFRLGSFQDTSSAVSFSPSNAWQTAAGSQYYGGSTRWSTSYAASASIQFSASSIALVTATGSSYGPVHIYVDGFLAETVNLNATPYGARRIVFARYWPEVGLHTFRVEIAGNIGVRGDFDALLFTR